MEYFKKCPKCGRYMKPYMHYKYGNSYTVWFCDCGYFEDSSGTGTYTTQTTYTGGGASDRTVTEKFKDGRNILRKGIENIHHIGFGQFYAGEAIDKLSEYETAEEEGRLVVLPCKNWLDIVFGEQELFYGIDMDYIENPIREITVHNEERFTWYDGWKTVVLKGVDKNGLDWEFVPEEIGKTVFFTREEAEKALKEMEGKHE